MADISRYPFLRHLRATRPRTSGTSAARSLHEGVGQSFWYRPLTAVLSEVPVDDRELPLLFHARTPDFPDVTVQATVTYRSPTRRWPPAGWTSRSTRAPAAGAASPARPGRPRCSPSSPSSPRSTCSPGAARPRR